MNKLPEGSGRHPAEEELADYALCGGNEALHRHCAECPACATAVEEFREVKRRIASLDEKAVPVSTERRILNITRHGHSRGGLLSGLQALVANPLLAAVAVVAVVVLLYFLLASEIFK